MHAFALADPCPTSYLGDHHFGDLPRVVVLPRAKREPAGGAKLPVGVAISCSISFDLFTPVGPVDGGCALAVGRTPVPVAAVDEQRNAGRPKDNISTPTQVLQRGCVDAVSQPVTMQ